MIGKETTWSKEVKMKAGYVCEDCGEMDRELLDSHHTIPKAECPDLADRIDNGKCKCLFDHAVKHRDDRRLMEHILARLGLVLWARLNPSRRLEAREIFDEIMK